MERKTVRKTRIEIYEERDRKTNAHKERQTDRMTDQHPDIQNDTGRLAFSRHTDMRKDRQTDN